MVKIKFTYHHDKYQSLEMYGHAQAGDYGHDLVCAGLTAIISGAMNAFDLRYEQDVTITVEDNKINLKINNLNNHELQLLFGFLKIQFETIAIQYPKNAQLKEVR